MVAVAFTCQLPVVSPMLCRLQVQYTPPPASVFCNDSSLVTPSLVNVIWQLAPGVVRQEDCRLLGYVLPLRLALCELTKLPSGALGCWPVTGELISLSALLSDEPEPSWSVVSLGVPFEGASPLVLGVAD